MTMLTRLCTVDTHSESVCAIIFSVTELNAHYMESHWLSMKCMKSIEACNTIFHFTNVKDEEDEGFHSKTCRQTKTHPNPPPRALKQPKPEWAASFSTLTCHLVIYDIVWPFSILIRAHICPNTTKSSQTSILPSLSPVPHPLGASSVWLQGKTAETSASCLWLLITKKKKLYLVIIGIASLKCFSQFGCFHLFQFFGAVKVFLRVSRRSDFHYTK